MTPSINQYIAWLPEGTVWVFSLTLVLLLAGWISSITIAVKHKWMALLALIPVTNPIAVVSLLYKHGSIAWVPLACYGLALILWISGGKYAHRIEFQRLNTHITTLEAEGESLDPSIYARKASDPSRNVWDHPYLSVLARAGQMDAIGESAREEMQDAYKHLRFPNRTHSVSYDDAEPDRLPLTKPQKLLLEQSIQWLLQENPEMPHTDLPVTTEQAAAALAPYFDQIAPDLAKLREAVFRPEDVYPHNWDRGFELLLPQLSKLKGFSQVASLASIYHTVQGNPEAAYQYLELGFQLAETGDSDILISRLVQFAQLAITLNGIAAAQQHHAWSEDQWLAVQARLRSHDFIGLMPDCFRSERTLGSSSITPLIHRTWSQSNRSLIPADVFDQREASKKPFDAILDPLVSTYSQAFLAKQWRQCLEAYAWMIQDLEQSAQSSKTEAWKHITVEWEDGDFRKYGLFATMLLPALNKAHDKAIRIQTQLRLASTAIDLERYYLRHGEYPDTLEALVPDLLDKVPVDPMTGNTLPYKRIGRDGFEIYSVGINGLDENGRHPRKKRFALKDPADDLLWRHPGSEWKLPSFELH